jgi:hypothetical protein
MEKISEVKGKAENGSRHIRKAQIKDERKCELISVRSLVCDL